MLSIIVPAHNEEAALMSVVADLRATHPKAEIVIVNDGSSDNTGKICAGLVSDGNVKCVNLEKNHGKTVAFAKGLKVAKGESLVMFESDGQYDPKDIAQMVEKLKNFDVVNGVRMKRIEGGLRAIMSDTHTILQKILFGVPVRDVNSGLKAFRREAALALFSEKILRELNGLKSYHRIMLSVAGKLGYTVGEASVHHYARKGGKSYISPFKTPLLTLATFIKLIFWQKS